MSEQDGTEATTKQRRSRKTSTANQQNGKQAPATQRPANDDTEAWKEYWRAQGQPWRTKPEIDAERQKYLSHRRAIPPEVRQGIYPFGGIKLTRADVEWLLATHENGYIKWNDINQRERFGLDLHGAHLQGEDLSRLPLSRTRGGLLFIDLPELLPDSMREAARIHLEGARLHYTHLEGAELREAHMEGALIFWSHLEEIILQNAHLEGTILSYANLKNANLAGAHLERALLEGTHLEGAALLGAHLEGSKLRGAFFDHTTRLGDIVLGFNETEAPSFADVRWGDTNLAVVKWSGLKMLGDEYEASQKKRDGRKKGQAIRLEEYEKAVRANSQLAVALQEQGLNEVAARFAYHAQFLQKSVLFLQLTQHGVTLRQRLQKFGAWFFSWILFLLAGYGYRPGRSVVWYLIIIFGFALSYHVFGGLTLFPPDAFVFSIMSFHGRGFFPSLSSETNLHNPLVMLAAVEAIVGLLIEISFIATFTQRFFGK